jgi:hypothetical protein
MKCLPHLVTLDVSQGAVRLKKMKSAEMNQYMVFYDEYVVLLCKCGNRLVRV